jgi:two-component system chemotaxis response regulator CheB
MTGMGRDGVEGCRLLKRQGAFIIAEHADTCVVYGMPKAVVEERLADCVVPLDRIADNVVRRVKRRPRT